MCRVESCINLLALLAYGLPKRFVFITHVDAHVDVQLIYECSDSI